MDIITGILAGGVLVPAAVAVQMQWCDHGRNNGSASESVMTAAVSLQMISALFAGILEPAGLHLAERGAPRFIPWRSMTARTAGVILVQRTEASGSGRRISPGPIRTRHSMIPKPQNMEDPRAHADAIVRNAPEDNPLRVHAEGWIARLQA